MFTETPGSDDACTHIVLTPNNSVGWRGNRRLILLVAVLLSAITTYFITLGATVVLFFSGVELLVLFILSHMVSRHCATKEVIHLTPSQVILQKGVSKPEQQWTFDRWHTRIEIRKNRSYQQEVLFIHKDNRISVRSFLTLDEKQWLIQRLLSATRSYRHLYL